MKEKVFKYNMSLYYQSLILYLTAMVIYLLLRIHFIGFDLKTFIHDEIIYLFLILMIYVVITMTYRLLDRRKIIITDKSIVISKWKKDKEIKIQDIDRIKVVREKRFHFRGLLRSVKIFLKNGSRIVIRPLDYVDDEELLKELLIIRDTIEKETRGKNV